MVQNFMLNIPIAQSSKIKDPRFPSFSHQISSRGGHFDKAGDQSMAQKPSSSSQVERAIPSRNEKSDRLCRDTNLSTTLLEKWEIM